MKKISLVLSLAVCFYLFSAAIPAAAGTPTTLSITALSPNPVSFGSTSGVTIKATLKIQTGTALAGYTVSFTVDSASVGTATTSSSGVATLSPSYNPSGLAVGSHTVAASFAGAGAYDPCATLDPQKTLTVNPAATSLTVSSASANSGAAATLKATLKAGATALVGYIVSFKVDGSSAGTATTVVDGRGIMYQ